MSKHKETGLKGELIAQNFLLNKGYIILHVNWRFVHKEVDIIAKKDNVLIFVEVKTRRNFNFGFPEEAVNSKKQALLKVAAQEYINQFPHLGGMRFDIISILLEETSIKEILHYEDAFY